MLTREEDVDADALRKQGWTISAIARHLGRDRKTVRAYLNGERVVGLRVSAAPDPFEPYAAYCQARLGEDPHLWATALFDDVVALGFGLSYQSFARGLRARWLRPAREPCRPAKGRPVQIIDHPAGEETQWDWLELPDPPGHWDGYRGKAFLLVGALSHSGKWRGVPAESDDQPHLLDALHRVAIKLELGGLTRDWRFDRMAVVYPSSGRVTPSFRGVAKHSGVHVVACPPRRGNRRGVVEKGNHSAAQRWWRTRPDDLSIVGGRGAPGRVLRRQGRHPGAGGRRARHEAHGRRDCRRRAAPAGPGRGLPGADRGDPHRPTASPRRVPRQPLLRAPELVGQTVTLSHRLGSNTLDVSIRKGIRAPRSCWPGTAAPPTVPASPSAPTPTSRRSRPQSCRRSPPPRRTARRSGSHLGPTARAAAEQLRANQTSTPTPTHCEVVIDLAT